MNLCKKVYTSFLAHNRHISHKKRIVSVRNKERATGPRKAVRESGKDSKDGGGDGGRGGGGGGEFPSLRHKDEISIVKRRTTNSGCV
jgi:uncharacterized membrane protein